MCHYVTSVDFRWWEFWLTQLTFNWKSSVKYGHINLNIIKIIELVCIVTIAENEQNVEEFFSRLTPSESFLLWLTWYHAATNIAVLNIALVSTEKMMKNGRICRMFSCRTILCYAPVGCRNTNNIGTTCWFHFTSNWLGATINLHSLFLEYEKIVPNFPFCRLLFYWVE